MVVSIGKSDDDGPDEKCPTRRGKKHQVTTLMHLHLHLLLLLLAYLFSLDGMNPLAACCCLITTAWSALWNMADAGRESPSTWNQFQLIRWGPIWVAAARLHRAEIKKEKTSTDSMIHWNWIASFPPIGGGGGGGDEEMNRSNNEFDQFINFYTHASAGNSDWNVSPILGQVAFSFHLRNSCWLALGWWIYLDCEWGYFFFLFRDWFFCLRFGNVRNGGGREPREERKSRRSLPSQTADFLFFFSWIISIGSADLSDWSFRHRNTHRNPTTE